MPSWSDTARFKLFTDSIQLTSLEFLNHGVSRVIPVIGTAVVCTCSVNICVATDDEHSTRAAQSSPCIDSASYIFSVGLPCLKEISTYMVAPSAILID